MTQTICDVAGIHRLSWAPLSDDAERPTVRLTFHDRRDRPLQRSLVLSRLEIGDRTLEEHLYAGCDRVTVVDLNTDGGQREFGRYCVRFHRAGAIVGEYIADEVTVT